jgi:hypothetical protein
LQNVKHILGLRKEGNVWTKKKSKTVNAGYKIRQTREEHEKKMELGEKRCRISVYRIRNMSGEDILKKGAGYAVKN